MTPFSPSDAAEARDDPPPGSRPPLGLLALLVLSGVLYWAFVPDFVRGAHAAAEAADALRPLALMAGLWAVLGVALMLGQRDGAMPGWACWVAAIIVPLSAVTTVLAEDAPGTRVWAHASAILLPVLYAGFALWARLPALHRRLPAPVTAALVWGTAAFLTFGAFIASLR